MSAQSHTHLPWTVRRAGLPRLSLRCRDCRYGSATPGAGRFRVNANGKRLDVWLLVRCVACDRTRKITVHERTPVASLDPAALDGYHVSAPEAVATALLDPLIARRNRFALDWSGAWRLDAPAPPAGGPPPGYWKVEFRDPVPVRPGLLIARGLGLSRSAVQRRVQAAVPLRRMRSTGFTFTLLPEGQPEEPGPEPVREVAPQG
ncbi:DUF1062 domain-containing protein [Nocardiopsis coralliicola]